MPVYMYRREDGTTFEYRQKFSDEPLTVDPDTGQNVVRVVQSAGIIFKGSGFYVNDSKGSKKSLSSANGNGNGKEDTAKGDTNAKTETKTGAKSETKAAPAKSDAGKGSSSAAS